MSVNALDTIECKIVDWSKSGSSPLSTMVINVSKLMVCDKSRTENDSTSDTISDALMTWFMSYAVVSKCKSSFVNVNPSNVGLPASLLFAKSANI